MIAPTRLPAQHSSHLLYEFVRAFDRFPASIAPIREQLQKVSFFPAGVGLYVDPDSALPLPKFPVGGIMVIAHDWGTEGDFDDCKKKYNGAESMKNATWRNMLAFFQQVGINPGQCFYTNFFVGLRTSKKSTGTHPGIKDSEYVASCAALLVEQIKVQKPKIVLVLGAQVPKLMAGISDDFTPWASFTSFKQLDIVDIASIPKVTIPSLEHSFAAVSLVHPCYRQRNAQLRQWRSFVGNEAEVELVKQALTCAGLNFAQTAR